MKDILERIVEARREDIAHARRERPVSSMNRSGRNPLRAFLPLSASPAPDARTAIVGDRRPLLIAECKRASPSRGVMKEDYDPAALAAAYERGGAGMISVITEPRFFLGSAAHLSAVRQTVSLPILRKDFIVDDYQIAEAWSIGADAILLIAAVLDRGALREFAASARERGLSVLVEIHGEPEIGMALACSPDAIGVNMRNLRDFSVAGGRSAENRALFLRSLLPDDIVIVAESGLKTGAEAAALLRIGYDAFLVGETFVTSADPEREVRSFVEALAIPDRYPGGRGPFRKEEP